MHKSVHIFSLAFLASMAMVLVAQPTSAANYTLNIDPGECVRVEAGDGSTPAGAEWAMSSTSTAAPFQGVVRSSGTYAYGPAIEIAHAGRVPSPGNYFFTACNVCPAAGSITVNFQLPDPPIGAGPQYFPSQDPGDLAGCNSTGVGLGGFEFDEVAVVLGPLGIVFTIGTLIFIIGLPAPAQAQQPPPPPQVPPAQPKPKLVPTPPIYPVQEGAAPPPMAGPGQRLLPTPWIGVWHRVPKDAPPQWPAGSHPPGYPFPQGTWSKMVCPFCQQLTLCPFQDGWFCDNLQCPRRPAGAGQTTELVSKEWYSP